MEDCKTSLVNWKNTRPFGLDEKKARENWHVSINSWQETCIALDLMEAYLDGPWARVDYAGMKHRPTWFLSNAEKGERFILIPNEYVARMAARPSPKDVLGGKPKVTYSRVEKMLRQIQQEEATPVTTIYHHLAMEDVIGMEENARMNLIARKITWLEDNALPADRPRNNWPTWHHHLNRVEGEDLICMKCLAYPDHVESMRKPTWSVLHISDKLVADKENAPPPTINDQYFLCPDCAGTHNVGDESMAHGITAMWVVQCDQDYYQPQPSILVGKHINSHWMAYTSQKFLPIQDQSEGFKEWLDKREEKAMASKEHSDA